jgi:hypothetical protein
MCPQLKAFALEGYKKATPLPFHKSPNSILGRAIGMLHRCAVCGACRWPGSLNVYTPLLICNHKRHDFSFFDAVPMLITCWHATQVCVVCSLLTCHQPLKVHRRI